MPTWLFHREPHQPWRKRWLRFVLWLVWGHLQTPVSVTAGRGAGGTGLVPPTPGTPAVDCSPDNIGTCLAQTLFSWVATQVQQAIQPVTDAILTNTIDIIYQTPAEDSYQEPTVMTINAVFVAAVDTALATLLVIGAYNLMVGEQLSLPHASFGELVARIVLVVGVTHFNLYFLGEFIELENALALEVDHASGIAQLANLLAGLVTNPGMTLITFVLMIIISLFVLWLLGQMIVRIALVAVCTAVAPSGVGMPAPPTNDPLGAPVVDHLCLLCDGPACPGDRAVPGRSLHHRTGVHLLSAVGPENCSGLSGHWHALSGHQNSWHDAAMGLASHDAIRRQRRREQSGSKLFDQRRCEYR